MRRTFAHRVFWAVRGGASCRGLTRNLTRRLTQPRRPSRPGHDYDLVFVERGEWDDEPEYPRAPLPAHERTWRHPSEQGATAWTQSEPPLVVGKGLSVATGTVGAVLAVGLLWLMIPHNNRSGNGVAQVSSTVNGVGTDAGVVPRQTNSPLSIQSSSPVTDDTIADDGTLNSGTTGKTFVASTSAPAAGAGGTPTGNTTSASNTAVSSSDTELPETQQSPPSGNSTPPSSSGPGSSTPTTGSSGGTVSVPSISVTPTTNPTVGPTTATTAPPSVTTSTTPSTTTPGRLSDPPVALAVALAPGHFVAATAAAVGDQTSLNVQLPTGDTVVGDVVSVNESSGIAVLSIPDDMQTTPIATSSSATATNDATVMGPEPTPASVWKDDSGTQITYDSAADVAEGSLVLDSANRLIGMCTTTANGVQVVGADALLAAINGAIANERPWLGLKAPELTVTEVAPGGPAAAAEIEVGDVIHAVDAEAVTGFDELRTIVQSHRAGDTVILSVTKVGTSAPVDVAVVLASDPGSL